MQYEWKEKNWIKGKIRLIFKANCDLAQGSYSMFCDVMKSHVMSCYVGFVIFAFNTVRG